MTKTLILISAGLFSGASLAQPPVVVTSEALPSRVVSFADLNLGSPAGQDRLVHRIRAAAQDLCIEGNKEELKIEVARKQCYWTALANGYRQMHSAIATYASGAPMAAATLVVSKR